MLFTVKILQGQSPHHFAYNDENGLPSNEIYSIVQDKKGFIWIGCDAGLYKFDGVRYIPYKCNSQNSKSITGLTISSSGRLYCFNFHSQLFYIENDTLKELKKDIPEIVITNLISTDNGKIMVSHSGGVGAYDEASGKWKEYLDFNPKQMFLSGHYVAKIATVTPEGVVYFVKWDGVGLIKDEKIHFTPTSLFKNLSLGRFHLEYYNGRLWIFSAENNQIYVYNKEKITPIGSKKLLKSIENRKITNVKSLPDGKLWICTYKGVISYDPSNDSAQLFYPELSFSDCIYDREGNYWFGTLQTGLLRVPNLEFVVWDKSNDLIKNDKITKITASDEFIYFASVNGTIGQLDRKTHQVAIFHTRNSGDIQSLDFEPDTKRLWFFNNGLYYLQNGNITEQKHVSQPIKARKEINGDCFLATSHGTFVNDEKINGFWSREIEHDSVNNSVWVATNVGLLKYGNSPSGWRHEKTFLDSVQVLSIHFDAIRRQLFALSFNGKIYGISANDDILNIADISDKIQPYKIKYHNQKLYVATNKGLWIYNLANEKWTSFTKHNGLASDNVQQLSIIGNEIWLATGKGVQRIPVDWELKQVLPWIFLKKAISGTEEVNPSQPIHLQYAQPLLLYPEVSSYRSNGKFEYAYRVNQNHWIKLPATVVHIEIQHIPYGNFTVELKAIDHLGRDSENMILLKGYVSPPFYNTWWFVGLLLLLSAFITFIIVKKIISDIRKKEQTRTQLLNSQLTALKAQMNPHFMYNALNSIQALILKQDIKNSNLYLSKFSYLMRKVLDVSGKDEISLQEETDILHLYLSLENLRFGEDFSYSISLAADIDVHNTMLPPLLLQPFVENAIKHGLLHKKGEKELQIDFTRKNGLLCTITDNGIGQKRARQIKERQNEKHTSFSTQATQKRIELLNYAEHKKIHLKIEDIYEDGQAAGTKVFIYIPM